tara:strand:- start:4215 stop:4649 length:435 start_codon:yes stop_codon:yes gene_type:complete
MSRVRSAVAIANQKKYYPSNVMNQIIVNAVTGVKYPYRVGTKDALRLYKVTDTTGCFSSKGKKKNTDDLKEGQEKDPNHYYFDNPAEYMQARSFDRHPESCDEWSKYQKSLLNSDGIVDISVYQDKRKKHHHLPMVFINKITAH